MKRKQLIWFSITIIWGIISITYIKLNVPKTIEIGGNKRESNVTIHFPFRIFNKEKGFIALDTEGNSKLICYDYLQNEVINAKYEHNGKNYVFVNARSINFNSEFKHNDQLKIILSTKKNIQKCKFNILIYPGKINLFMKGLIFFIFPLLLVLKNIIIPLLKFIKSYSS